MSDDGLSLAIQGVKDELESCQESLGGDGADQLYIDGYRQALQDTLDNLAMLQRSMRGMGF